ncbi:hypothetical protein FH972_023787 [Carpinus fangiana]|uniref:5'-deoxynucleotidase n=1 Tax=Carpinus fangiana TaxID=176857 RepID=A0A5N6KWZ5_9ROSI|nr:hypothetical protein FH972_023787 [Carpinus fangiana]
MSPRTQADANAPPPSSTYQLSPTAAPSVELWTPQSVIASLPAHSAPSSTGSASPIPFFHMLSRLKTTKREGWRRFGISNGESVSDHMYRMSILTLLAPPSLRASINIERCTILALVHDMAELLVGDITPVDGIAKSEKNRREASTMDYLCQELLGSVDGGVQGREIRAAWQEYEDGASEESKFVHDIDKMELILQMVEYERAAVDGTLQPDACLPKANGVAQLNGSVGNGPIGIASAGNAGNADVSRVPLDLGEFTWVAQKIECAEVQVWAAEVLRERRRFWDQRGMTPQDFSLLADP